MTRTQSDSRGVSSKEDSFKHSGLPDLPSHKGHERTKHNPDGTKERFKILDEIHHIQSTNPKKAFYLQKIRFDDDGSGRFKGRTELRLAYWIIGEKKRMKDKWAFGQYAPMIPVKDFNYIIRKAKRKGFV